jgi:hypothetical protein
MLAKILPNGKIPFAVNVITPSIQESVSSFVSYAYDASKASSATAITLITMIIAGLSLGLSII